MSFLNAFKEERTITLTIITLILQVLFAFFTVSFLKIQTDSLPSSLLSIESLALIITSAGSVALAFFLAYALFKNSSKNLFLFAGIVTLLSFTIDAFILQVTSPGLIFFSLKMFFINIISPYLSFFITLKATEKIL